MSGGHWLDGRKGAAGGSLQTLILIRLEKLYYFHYVQNCSIAFHTHKGASALLVTSYYSSLRLSLARSRQFATSTR